MVFGALAALGASWAGWIVSCACALMLFPGYPGPTSAPEWLAILFTVPGLGTGALALHWLYARRAPVRGTVNGARVMFAILAVSTAALACGLVKAHAVVTMWPARRALPESAIVLSENAYDGGFPLPDYSYSMRARMSAPDFGLWMERLGLEQVGDDATRYEREGTTELGDGATGSYSGGVALFESWCR